MNVFEILTNWLLDQLATRWLVIEKKTQKVFHRNNRNDCGIPDHTHLTFDLKDIIMITKKITKLRVLPLINQSLIIFKLQFRAWLIFVFPRNAAHHLHKVG